MTMTENQAKAADLLSMLRERGMDTMAGELQELLAGAWDEGEVLGESMEFGYRRVENPYRGLPVRETPGRD